MADKAIAEMLRQLAPIVDQWFVGDMPMSRAIAGCELARSIRLVSPAAVTCEDDIEAALRAALLVATDRDRVIVFGSFVTVAQLLPE